MTKEDVIRLARQVQKDCELSEEGYTLWSHEALVAFANLAIAEERKEFAVHAVDIARRAVEEEREACADLVFYMVQNIKVHTDKPAWVVLHEAQAAIRARGKA